MITSATRALILERSWKYPRGKRLVVTMVTVLSLFALCATLIYISGGAKEPSIQTLYIPVLMSAFMFDVWGGLLHDLGKVAIPEDILVKPTKLTHDEYEKVKSHADVGASMIESISKDLALIAEGIKHHHEHWDGSGYPDGLKGEDIPIFGRIICILDVFEALTSVRPYRNPMSGDEALKYIEQASGKLFDPSIVSVFVDLYTNGKLYIGDTKPDIPVDLEIPVSYNSDTG